MFINLNVVFFGFGFDDELLDILIEVKGRMIEQKTIATTRRLDPSPQEPTHFAFLNNEVILKSQKVDLYSPPRPLTGSEKDQNIAIEDAVLRDHNVIAVRFNAGDVYKSIERIISELRNETKRLDYKEKAIEV
jgi:hypothetical protein